MWRPFVVGFVVEGAKGVDRPPKVGRGDYSEGCIVAVEGRGPGWWWFRIRWGFLRGERRVCGRHFWSVDADLMIVEVLMGLVVWCLGIALLTLLTLLMETAG